MRARVTPQLSSPSDSKRSDMYGTSSSRRKSPRRHKSIEINNFCDNTRSDVLHSHLPRNANRRSVLENRLFFLGQKCQHVVDTRVRSRSSRNRASVLVNISYLRVKFGKVSSVFFASCPLRRRFFFGRLFAEQA